MDIVKQGDLFFEKNDSGKVIGLVFSGENLEAEIEAIKENQIDSIAFNR